MRPKASRVALSASTNPMICPAEQHHDPVRNLDQLIQIAGNEQHGAALFRRCQNTALDVIRRGDVNAPGRLRGNEHPAAPVKLPGDDDFLLIAAGEGADHNRLIGGRNAVIGDLSLRITAAAAQSSSSGLLA